MILARRREEAVCALHPRPTEASCNLHCQQCTFARILPPPISLTCRVRRSGAVWKEHEPLPLQSWGVEPPPHLAATRKLQGRTLSGRTPPASPAHQHGAGREEEYGHGTFVLKNPDRASSNDSDPGLIGPGHGGEPDELVEGDGVEVSVTFGVGKIGIQYRLAQASSARDATVTSGRCEVLVIGKLVPGGLAVMCSAPHLQPGDILTKVNGESVKGQRYAGLLLFASTAV